MAGGALDWIPGELDLLERQGLRRRLEPISGPPGPTVEVDGRNLL